MQPKLQSFSPFNPNQGWGSALGWQQTHYQDASVTPEKKGEKKKRLLSSNNAWQDSQERRLKVLRSTRAELSYYFLSCERDPI